MVPSWTETLIQAGVNVVGRTRFCVHPHEEVASIPVVGGTKEVDWNKVGRLRPDLLVLDREENPRWMAQESAVPWIATHVQSVGDVDPALRRLHERLPQDELLMIAERWRNACTELGRRGGAPSWSQLPGVIDWVRRPGDHVDRFVYLIWKDPWMAVGPDTFVGSMLGVLGFGSRMVPLGESGRSAQQTLHPPSGRSAQRTLQSPSGRSARRTLRSPPPTEKYPRVSLEDLDPSRTLLLCASEPYPFDKRRDVVGALPFPAAIVDGECFSWFGVRALQFLEDHLTAGG